MLRTIRLLQVGDVHLTTSAGAKPFVDVKDSAFPSGLAAIISANPLKRVFKRIYEELEHSNVDALLFMGDLTDYGKIDGYEACCRFLTSALQVGGQRRHSHVPIGIVPGNHDIDRSLARLPGLTTKFTPLAQALSNVGISGLPISSPTHLPIGKPGLQASIFLLNSCWGCGDEMQIPEEFRKPIADAIDVAISGGGADSAIKAYYDRQLDTPALSEAAISETLASLKSLPGTQLPIIVAHHNLLPQRLPRLAPYTELVNGGALRASLAELNRPLLYLHGHIHEDPIEIIQAPKGPPVISISAPAAVAGFNIIEIVLSPTGLPLSCHIVPVRFDQSGMLGIRPKIVISLGNGRRRYAEPSMMSLYAKILDLRLAYWTELELLAVSEFGRPTTEKLVEMLELLFADGLVLIENYDLPVANWILRAEL